MGPNPGTLCAAAVMLSSAIGSGPAGRDSAVLGLHREKEQERMRVDSEGTGD